MIVSRRSKLLRHYQQQRSMKSILTLSSVEDDCRWQRSVACSVVSGQLEVVSRVREQISDDRRLTTLILMVIVLASGACVNGFNHPVGVTTSWVQRVVDQITWQQPAHYRSRSQKKGDWKKPRITPCLRKKLSALSFG